MLHAKERQEISWNLIGTQSDSNKCGHVDGTVGLGIVFQIHLIATRSCGCWIMDGLSFPIFEKLRNNTRGTSGRARISMPIYPYHFDNISS